MKRLVVIAAALAVGAGGVAATTGSAAAAPAQPVARIAWGACPADDPYLENAECGKLQVPLDHAKPGGRKISVAVSRVKHTDTKNYRGVLLANPGGPGGSGLYLSGGLSSWLPPEVAAKYDVIGFDPRGVGASEPALTCDPNYEAPVRPEYEPRSIKDEAVWLAKSKRYADACAKKFGWVLPYMRTTDAARDVDAIRAALGADKINYYGFSYGTYLGATYATLFPNRVKRMVWDGNVDSRDVWYKGQLSQNVAFERNFKLWTAWVAKYDSVYHLGATAKAVEAKYYAVRAAARKAPIGGKVGPSELTDIVLNAGYHTGYYPIVAGALAAWVNDKNPTPLASRVNPGGDDNGFAVYNAVQAVDAPWPSSWRTWHRDASRQYASGSAKFLAWSNVWFNAPIHFWHAKDPRKAFPIGSAKAPAILLVQSTLDAATPYDGGPQMRALFPKARLIAEQGGKTHSNTLNGNACLDDRVAAYLDSGALPARKPGRTADVTCQALPDPVPSGATAKSTQNRTKDLPVGRW
ncbi:alpha/beta hydrolase [Actinomadura flavalba]|uniref:alpha/beta hydrolase n=1 Tax=Actinomadura flavalba TaxID=1120938 RepID=UPI001F0A8A8B|nr:alpha/beta hydrolase [Actinomadura flavalba]